MIATIQDCAKVANYGHFCHMITLLITNHCNAYCDHCIESSSPELDDIISDDIIDNVIGQLKNNNWLLSIQGGEPMMKPDLVAKIVGLAKKNNIATSLVTNGFWGNDFDLVNQFKNDIATDYMVISTDYWHQKFVNVDIIGALASSLSSCPTKILFSSVDYRGHELDFPNEFGLLKISLPLYLNKVGRGFDINKDNFIKTSKTEQFCPSMGFRINWDGFVTSCCPNESKGCQFGNIKDLDLNLAAKLFVKSRRKAIIEYENYAQYCFVNDMQDKIKI